MKPADRDLVALGVASAAILMFVGTGSTVLPKVVQSWAGVGEGPDALLVNALLLNIALIIFGWRRYNELLREIEQRKLAEEQARKLAETDPLTGCLNRRTITAATDGLIAEQAAQGGGVVFLMIDLDNFKQVNDLYGHVAGDQVLRTAAERISALVTHGGLVARLGGDEFACVLPCSQGDDEVVDGFAARLIERVSAPTLIEGTSVEVTVSVGIASNVPVKNDAEHACDAKELMHKSDIAMYHAKKRGKNRCFRFEPQMESELRFRHKLEQAVRRGVEQREFVPFYEQQVDLETGELVGFEMLARWNCREMGSLGPTVFIPVAEEIGLIADLSEQLIARALEDAKEWDPSLRLAVNISPIQLRDAWFAQRLLKLLVAHNFPPDRLEIEITESCLHEDIAVVRSLITSLRNQGVKISLDDFGTGYSSLSQLRSLPFDQLKIDRTFVSELRDSGTGAQILDAIVRLGDGLKMPITAEGIEDAEILRELIGFKSLKGQGYHYGKPENAAAVRARLCAMGRLAPASAPAAQAPAEDESRSKAREA
ncbi:EAL domain-containing protein [Leptolyngbya sp. 15MV]|nr:EAL domain-containing protein [Leptolyngbya sp. 15MV]